MLLISGCATFRELPPETRAMEVTWQSLHAIDAAQTLSIARDPDCYSESLVDPAIGRHPPPGLVLAWTTGTSVLHFAITDLLSLARLARCSARLAGRHDWVDCVLGLAQLLDRLTRVQS